MSKDMIRSVDRLRLLFEKVLGRMRFLMESLANQPLGKPIYMQEAGGQNTIDITKVVECLHDHNITKRKISGMHPQALANMVASTGLIKDQGSLVGGAFAARALANDCPAFHFDSAELSDRVIGSQFSRVPIKAIKMPRPALLIGLSKKYDFVDNSGDKFDVIGIQRDVFGIIDEQGSEAVVWLLAFWDSEGDGRINWVSFKEDECVSVNEENFLGKDGKVLAFDGMDKKVGTQAFLMAAKFVAFLVSTASELEVIHRKVKKPVKGSGKNLFPKVTIVRMNKEYAKKYEYDDDTPSGRKQQKRCSVVGHFKPYTKGPLAGRILWISEHERGPEDKELVHSDHLVE